MITRTITTTMAIPTATRTGMGTITTTIPMGMATTTPMATTCIRT